MAAGALVTDWVDLPAETGRSALVIHHGGAGSYWAALAAGVPAVMLPQAADQFRNADCVAEAGAGVVVSPAVQEVPELAAIFAAAWRDASLAAGSRRVRDANEALPDIDALIDDIEAAGWRGGRGRVDLGVLYRP